MAFLYLVGPNINLVREIGSVTMSPSAVSGFGESHLYDNRPGTVARFSTYTDPSTLTVDLTDGVGGNGGFETWTGGATGVPNGWTESNTGAGTVVEDVVTVYEGIRSAKFGIGAGGTAMIYKRFTDIPAGQKRKISAAFYEDSFVGFGNLHVLIRNLTTGNYLQSGGTWSASPGYALTSAGAAQAWAALSLAFQVESFADCGSELVTLEVRCLHDGNGAGNGYIDAVSMLPGVDFCSVHGHNLDPTVASTLRSSTDGFSASDLERATLTFRQPAFYAYLTSGGSVDTQYYRYWRLKIGANNSTTNSTSSGLPYVGEWILGQAKEVSAAPQYGLSVGRKDVSVRGRVGLGGSYAFDSGAYPQRTLSMKFKPSSADEMDELRDLFLRAKGGYPVVIVPSTDEGDVIMGRLSESMSQSRVTTTISDVSGLDVEELAFPVITS